jgi:amino acid adenylation domain-containing protein
MSPGTIDAQDIIREVQAGRLAPKVALQQLQQLKESVHIADVRIPLSEGQRGLWITEKLNPGTSAYNVPWCFQLHGALDTSYFEIACRHVVAQFPILSSCVEEQNGLLWHRCKSPMDFSLVSTDVSGWSFEETLAHIERITKEPFSLEREMPVRFRVFSRSADDHILLLNVHHMVIDGRSAPTLLSSLFAAYERAMRGEILVAEPRTDVYRAFVEWEQTYLLGDMAERDRQFWSAQLSGPLPTLALPRDRPRVEGQSGIRGKTFSQPLPIELGAGLKSFARSQRVNCSVVFLAAYQVLLQRYSGETDIIVGMPTMHRPQERFDGLIGYFINMLPLRMPVGGSLPFVDVLRSAQLALADALDHASYPFSKIVADLKVARTPGHSPIFHAAFGYQNAQLMTLSAGQRHLGSDRRVEGVDGIHQEGEYELLLEVLEQDETFRINLKYDPALYEQASIRRMMGHLECLLRAVVVDPGREVQRLPLLAEEEYRQLLTDWGACEEKDQESCCIHELFERQVACTPEAVALVTKDTQVSYRELDSRASALAQQLRNLGVLVPDTRVAVCVSRGPNMVVSWLAALKAGAAFVPLDPGYPPERLIRMLEDCTPGALLIDGAGEAVLQAAGSQIPRIRAEVCEAFEPWSPRAETLPTHLAYVIYTSGSSGEPKGVMVEHRQIVNLLRAITQRYSLSSKDRVLQFVSPSFDVAIQEVFAPLIAGASVVFRGDDWISSPSAFWGQCAQQQITVAHLPASFWQQLNAQQELEAPVTLRVLAIGGESIGPQALSAWFERRIRPTLLNEYGPTETTVTATVHEFQASSDRPTCIGRPITNVRFYILDTLGQPVPIGVAGEIYIGGAGVARGYLDRPAETAERYVTDPLHPVAGARMYRTGDRARWRSDGTIEFLGRTDEQVKLRGFRIELGEVEARLRSCAGVGQALVMVREDTPGDRRLVAYVAGRRGQAGSSAVELREQLSRHVPDFMIPAAFVRLEELPLTLNGKVDRTALLAPCADAYATRGFEEPLGDQERTLARLWQDLLSIERVGRQDHFFDLGGHSLLAVRLVERIRQQLNVELSFTDVFAHPTLSDLARELATRLPQQIDTRLQRIDAADRGAALRLSFAQQRLWFITQLDPEASTAYHIPVAMDLNGTLDRSALQSALDRIVSRHEVLRTRFRNVEGVPVQHIVPDHCGLPLRYDDVSDVQFDLSALLSAEIHSPFDLSADLPIRARLLRLAVDRHALVLTLHHIICDGWSMAILTSELSALYTAYRQGAADTLPALDIQYADYAAWQRQRLNEERQREQIAYWTANLRSAPHLLRLPTDRPHPPKQQYSGGAERVRLDRALTRALGALGRKHGATLYMTLLAGWALVLSRLSGQRDVVVGTPVANRNRLETESLIGFFVNTLPIRLTVPDSGSLADFIAQVREVTLTAQRHQDIPFEQIVEAVAPPRTLVHSPLFQVLFAWQNVPQAKLDLPGLEVSALEPSSLKSQFDLSLALQETDEEVTGILTYAVSLYERSTVRRYLSCWVELLRSMARAEDVPIDALSLLEPSEQRQLVHRSNRPWVDCSNSRCIHEIFEDQAARTPDATAATFGAELLTYSELNLRANQLARYLREVGVRPDTRVAMCVDRGLNMLIGVLAILKSGGGYVPLDPTYPTERLAYVLRDSDPVALLTESRFASDADWIPASLRSIRLDDPANWAHHSTECLDSETLGGLTARHLAYVIYTSGSTGQPKGVMVEHCNVTRLFRATEHWYRFGASDVWTLFHSYAFDFSVWEIWGALLTGGRLVIVPQLTTRDPRAFYELLCREGVTILNQTPTAFRQLVSAQAQSSTAHRLRQVIFGGESLDVSILEHWYARNAPDRTQLANMYGITETTVHVTYRALTPADVQVTGGGSPIGQRIADLAVYILDSQGAPVPVGVVGEMHVGGAGVARGYLNRPDLTAQRFVPDRFAPAAGARMYRTGDLGRWRSDGTLEFVGRNDKQVKIRGFRIELGEIEAQIRRCPSIREAVVLVQDNRLIAYVCVRDPERPPSSEELRSVAADQLPEHMVPAAFVQLDTWPLTANGKLDVAALPIPDSEAFARRDYEAPVGPIESALAEVWQALLGLERIGRQDHFFQLGGHSLLIVQMIDRLEKRGLSLEVRSVFATPRLTDLATTLGTNPSSLIEVPPNLIPDDCTKLTPQLLPLVGLTHEEIEVIEGAIQGGAANVQDIYPLVPLQQGILFHHLLGEEGDPYLLNFMLSFDCRERLNRFLSGLQAVINRHDILRTSFHWEGLSEPVQVVCRRAPLSIEEVAVESGTDAMTYLQSAYQPRRIRLDVRRAPLMRAIIAHDPIRGRELLSLFNHHLVDDQTTLKQVMVEVQAHMLGQEGRLPEPLPFRNFVARARGGSSDQEHESFFRNLLKDVSEPTLPFGLADIKGDGSGVSEARVLLEVVLARELRDAASTFGVSAAALIHLAWGCVLARVCGRDDVVFGTVLFGRMRAGVGADRALGLFINTLPVRIRLTDVSVERGLSDTHQLLAQLLHHEQAPLAMAQRCSSVPAPAPLFSALLNCRQSQTSGEKVLALEGAWAGMEVHHGEDRTNYPVTLSVDDLGEGFQLTAQVTSALEPDRVCAYMATALESLVRALRSAPSTILSDIDILPAGEWSRILQWNSSHPTESRQRCIHELFERQVVANPDAVALIFHSQELTYRQLDEEANRLAHFLRCKGVGPDVRVAICVERSMQMVIGVLATLKAGGAYVPLDPHYPTARLHHALRDSSPGVLITEARLQQQLASALDDGCAVIDLQADRANWESLSDVPRSEAKVAIPQTTPDHLAYVIYTSGSTGQPKGVAMPHRALVNLIEWHLRDAELQAQPPRTLQFAALGFDVSFQEIFSTLCAGAALVLVDESTRKDPDALCSLLHELGIERLFLPAVALEQLAEAAAAAGVTLPKLRHVITAGEQLRITPTVRAFFRQHAQCRLHNHYGPTETHVVTAACLPSDPLQWPTFPSIGRPVDNARIYILDPHRRLAPVGVSGELYIGGTPLARGYLNQSDVTNSRFVPDVVSGVAGERMYRTGDLARWLPGGTIEFIGRNDDQVKIRGFRIELGEVEAQLRSLAGVRDAIASAYETAPGQKQLVGYLVAQDAVSLDLDAVRAHLEVRLPLYMIPATFVLLEALPVSANGKIDRRSLSAPAGNALASHRYEEPQGAVERALARVWGELLHVERISRTDNFFALGGHSLMIVQMIERLRRAGLSAQARHIFDAPTLAAMAGSVRVGANAISVPENRIPPDCSRLTSDMLPLIALTQEEIDSVLAVVPGRATNVQDIYPLAPLQEGILFHHLRAEQGDPYLLNFVLSFDTRVRLDAFLDALQRVIDRHDILRTSFHWKELSQPIQVVWRQARLGVERVALVGIENVVEQIHARVDPRRYRLELCAAPLLHAIVGETADGGQILSLFNHHLVCDHTTLEQVLVEVHAYVEGQSAALPQPVPFRNFVVQARRGVSEAEHRAFFSQMLGEVDESTSPFGLVDVQGDGTRIREARRLLAPELAARLRRCARRLSVSPATLFHVGWARVLALTSGRDDVVFGTVLIGRMESGAGSDRSLGLFINTLPIRIRTAESTVAQAVTDTHRLLSQLLRHEHASLAMAQRCSGVPAGAPLFSALLNYRHSPGVRSESASRAQLWPGVQMLHVEDRTNYPVTLSVDDLGEGFGLTAQITESINPLRVCSYVETALSNLMDALETAPATALCSIRILPSEERHQLLVDWNATQAEFPADTCIHQLFEAQVLRTPEAIAVESENGDLTYSALNRRANRLAHRLIEAGVRPDTLVAVSLERGLHMIEALLGILKSGAAYVPIDPIHPADRIQRCITDASPLVLVTQTSVAGQWDTISTPLILLDTNWDPGCSLPTENPNPLSLGLNARHLAYVIYTSGSTGEPKGAMNEHRSVVNRLCWMQDQYRLDATDRVLQKTPFTFDVSVWEMFWPLFTGARLVVARPEGHRDPLYLIDLIQRAKVTVAHFVPSMLRIFLDQSNAPNCTNLRHVMCSGEELSEALKRECLKIFPQAALANLYGPTEAAVDVSYWNCQPGELFSRVPIGRPIWNTQLYILDPHGEPVPIGAVGELHIGGVAVGRGYWNRPALTEVRFVGDPFAQTPSARMYKTGDLACFRSDGAIEFLGRLDHQLKLRGFRIEPGEIEAKLTEYPQVREAIVLLREDVSGQKRLVAYLLSENPLSAEDLRLHLQSSLPEYMIPTAFVALDEWPLTSSGKLDRRALPAPEYGSLARNYEPPEGPIETALAEVWQELLGCERVGRHDNFFHLGGHSLLIVQAIEKLRRRDIHIEVRNIFDASTLCNLASVITRRVLSTQRNVPANQIPPDCTLLTPDMLPLVQLTQQEVDRIVACIPGGAANIQDIYRLAPLQEGILFHHLIGADSDPYILSSIVRFESRERLDEFLTAYRFIINRHDILRTSFHWEGLPEPVQVVWRAAELAIEEDTSVVTERPTALQSPEGDSIEVAALWKPRLSRLDARRAPMIRAFVSRDVQSRMLLSLCTHHLICDHSTVEQLFKEVYACLNGKAHELPEAPRFRDFVATLGKSGDKQDHEAFFRNLLEDVNEPTAPFGLTNAQGDGRGISEAHVYLEEGLARRLRCAAKQIGVSVASLLHLAWARVVARTAGRDDVVFGTVLLGRMHGLAGVERMFGLLLNTLPIRIHTGVGSVAESVRTTQQLLAQLLSHEQAPLSLAQRCSSVPSPAPLFCSLLNYRHSYKGQRAEDSPQGWSGIEFLRVEERTNYPITLNVDDLGERFLLTAQVAAPIDAGRICTYVSTTLERLVRALEQAPDTPMASIDILPDMERRQLLVEWNSTCSDVPVEQSPVSLLEDQFGRAPESVALRYAGKAVTYGELDRDSAALARYLASLGVGPEVVVGLCLPPSIERVVAIVAILRCGGAVLALEPNHPRGRLELMVEDARAAVVLTQLSLLDRFPDHPLTVCVDRDLAKFTQEAPHSQFRTASAGQLAYVMFTSASTGRPKPVGLEHGSITNRIAAQRRILPLESDDVCIHKTSIGFVDSILEILDPLTSGRTLVIASESVSQDPAALIALIERMRVTRLLTAPPLAQAIIELPMASHCLARLRSWSLSGETLGTELLSRLQGRLPKCRFINLYGSTEVTADVTYFESQRQALESVPIGTPLLNAQVYLLDSHLQPVPIGASGEIYVAGRGLARGYLHRADLTAERFLRNPFGAAESRLFKTGDLGRFSDRGMLYYLGRRDHQVKIRGYRIELGEIEATLRSHPDVTQAIATARQTSNGNTSLTAYAVTTSGHVDADDLRVHLKQKLPRYMMPTHLRVVRELPLTATGKIDRKALDAIDSTPPVGFVEPNSPTEISLAAVWCQILGLDSISAEADFFDMGGHSLLGTRLMSQVGQMFGVKLPLRVLFDHPSVRQFARRLDSEQGPSADPKVPLLQPQTRTESAPLSRTQTWLWHLHQSVPTGRLRNIVCSIRLSGELRTEALARAWNGVVERHEALRVRVEARHGAFIQVTEAPKWSPLESLDLSVPGECTRRLDSLKSREPAEFIDLTAGPGHRAKLIKLGDVEHVLALSLHPLLVDEWSVHVIVRELSALYGAEMRSEANPLPAMSLQFPDYALWERSWLSADALAQSREFWKVQLRGRSHLRLFLHASSDEQRDPLRNGLPIALPEALYKRLRRLVLSEEATLYAVLLSVFQLVISEISGCEDVIVGTRETGRTQWQTRDVVGHFSNTLILRVQLERSLSFRQFLAQVKETIAAAGKHHAVPYPDVVDALSESHHSGRPQVEFLWRSAQQELEIEGLKFAVERIEGGAYCPDLALHVFESSDRAIALEIHYIPEAFDIRTIERFANVYLAALEHFSIHPDATVSTVEILSQRTGQNVGDEHTGT